MISVKTSQQGIADPRSLGLFRVSLGLLLIAHLVDHLCFNQALYRNNGVVPASLLPQSTEIPYFPSLLSWLDHFPGGFFCFLLFAIGSYLTLTIGFMTRLATLASLLAFSCISHRNPYLVIGADELIASMLLWSCLVPLEAAFSVDQRLHSVRLPHRLNGLTSRIAVAGLFVQVSTVYFATAWQKHGPTWWQDGTALIRVLGMSAYELPGAAFLRMLPGPVLIFLTYAALLLEYLLPFLILSPWQRPLCRRLAIAGMIGLHLLIAISVETGFFSLTMFVMTTLLPTTFDWSMVERICRCRFSERTEEVNDRTGFWSELRWFSEAAALFLFLGFGQEVWNRSFAPKGERLQISVIGLPWKFAGGAQRWSMFAPDPPEFDLRIQFRLRRDSGETEVIWDNQPNVNSVAGAINPPAFLWRLILQRALLMTEYPREEEGIQLRQAIADYFVRDHSRWGERENRIVESSSRTDYHSPIVSRTESRESIEFQVTATPTSSWYFPTQGPRTVRAARYYLERMDESSESSTNVRIRLVSHSD